MIEGMDGETSVGVVVELDGELASVQVFGGGLGISSDARVRFLGHAMRVTCSKNILGRTFRGTGEPIDGGPDLAGEPKVELSGPTVNPVMRSLPTRMIETEVPMIDLFNCLVESQKIPIFSTAGEPR